MSDIDEYKAAVDAVRVFVDDSEVGGEIEPPRMSEVMRAREALPALDEMVRRVGELEADGALSLTRAQFGERALATARKANKSLMVKSVALRAKLAASEERCDALIEALESVCTLDVSGFATFITENGVRMDMPSKAEHVVRAALAAARDGGE